MFRSSRSLQYLALNSKMNIIISRSTSSVAKNTFRNNFTNKRSLTFLNGNVKLQPAFAGVRCFSTSPINKNAVTDSSLETVSAAAATFAVDPVTLSESVPVFENLPYLGEMKDCGLGLGYFQGNIQIAMEYCTIYTGLPWWGTIAVTSLFVRALILPLQVKGMRNNAKLQQMKPEMDKVTENLKKARAAGNQALVMQHTGEMQAIFKRENVNPLHGLYPILIQMPILFTIFFSIRNMLDAPLLSLQNGGMLWFVDLTIPDNTYILPVLSAACTLATMETQWRIMPLAAGMEVLKTPMRAMAGFSVLFSMHFPSGLLCYWVSTATFTGLQILFLGHPAVRRFYRLPSLEALRKIAADDRNTPAFLKNLSESMKPPTQKNQLDKMNTMNSKFGLNNSTKPKSKTRIKSFSKKQKKENFKY